MARYSGHDEGKVPRLWSTSSSFPDDEGLDLTSGTICSQRIGHLVTLQLHVEVR